jgi:hypothetical protein
MEKIKKMTIAEKVLRFIAESPNGRMLGEIQKFIYEHNYPGQSDGKRKSYRYNERTGRSIPCEVKIYKGYWGTNLTGNPTNAGILESFCLKTADRRYVVTEEIKAPFFRRHGSKGTMTETYKLRRAKSAYDWKLREALSPKCAGCGYANVHGGEGFSTPDRKAHFNHWSVGNWKADCAGRVWSGGHGPGGLLTKLTKDQVIGLAECMRNKGAHYTLVEDTVHRFVLDNIVKEG